MLDHYAKVHLHELYILGWFIRCTKGSIVHVFPQVI